MFTPQTYSMALLLMTLSMLCWGTWANTQNHAYWPFELYYFDYTVGLLVVSLIIGLTLGGIHSSSPDSFFLNLQAAGSRSLWLAFAGGAVFSVGNIPRRRGIRKGHSPELPWWHRRRAVLSPGGEVAGRSGASDALYREHCLCAGGCGSRIRLYLTLMFLCFLLGLTSIALSPVIK